MSTGRIENTGSFTYVPIRQQVGIRTDAFPFGLDRLVTGLLRLVDLVRPFISQEAGGAANADSGIWISTLITEPSRSLTEWAD